MSVRTTIKNFIRCIAEEKYAEAHKYLQLALTEKFKQKVRTAIKSQRLF